MLRFSLWGTSVPLGNGVLAAWMCLVLGCLCGVAGV